MVRWLNRTAAALPPAPAAPPLHAALPLPAHSDPATASPAAALLLSAAPANRPPWETWCAVLRADALLRSVLAPVPSPPARPPAASTSECCRPYLPAPVGR